MNETVARRHSTLEWPAGGRRGSSSRRHGSSETVGKCITALRCLPARLPPCHLRPASHSRRHSLTDHKWGGGANHTVRAAERR